MEPYINSFRGTVRAVLLLVAIAGTPASAFWPFDGDQEAGKDLVLHGNVDIRQIDVAFEITGRIEQVAVDEGARVEEGQLLARLRAERHRQAVAGAQAEVAAQQAELAALEAGTRPEEIRRLRAEREAAKAEATNRARRLRRLEVMRDRELVSEETLDDARSALKVARARTKALQRRLDLALAGPREEDIRRARARLEGLEARLARARLDLEDTELRAPRSGVIRERLLQTGEMTGPDRPVFSLALTDPLWVRAYVPETRLGDVEPGTPATVHTDYGGGSSYSGWVGYVSPTAEFTPKNVETEELRTDLVYEVRIMVCNPEGQLRLGMPATVSIAPTAEPGATSRCDGELDAEN